MPSQDNELGAGGISRRGFLKGVGAGAVATGLVSSVRDMQEASAQVQANVKGPGNVKITLNINGNDQSVEVEPRVTLLDCLRNRLDITGAKKVCDRGTCGACTVMLDGEIVYSCSILAIEAEGHKITTVEGLGTPDNLHPVQKAFVEHDAQQCGFCTPGFVMATAAFVKAHPKATIEEIKHGLGGNLCRCGTYQGIIAVAQGMPAYIEGGQA